MIRSAEPERKIPVKELERRCGGSRVERILQRMGASYDEERRKSNETQN